MLEEVSSTGGVGVVGIGYNIVINSSLTPMKKLRQSASTLILATLTSISMAGCANLVSDENELPDDPLALTQKQADYLTDLYKSPVAWVTVEQLSEEFEDNSIVAEEKYTGKPVKVSGVIKSIDGDLGGSPVVQIVNKGDDFGFDSITCRNTTRNTARKLRKDMPITVIGIVDSTMLGVSMKLCQYQELL